jgi:hypothetical protein
MTPVPRGVEQNSGIALETVPNTLHQFLFGAS